MFLRAGLIMVVLMLVLPGCKNNSIVEEKFAVKDGKWNMKDTYSCKFNVTDTVGLYNFYLNVRNGGDYPYSNLYVFVNTVFPNGKQSYDTVECILADKNGKWLGSGLGDVLDNHILYRYNRQFPIAGEYRISLQHAMRDTVIPAILNLGISIERDN
jgi:gliding motility-associated lipoprotein GldH